MTVTARILFNGLFLLGFTSLGLDHRTLHGAGHCFCFLEAQTDQIRDPPRAAPRSGAAPIPDRYPSAIAGKPQDLRGPNREDHPWPPRR